MTGALATGFDDSERSPGLQLWRVTNAWQAAMRAALTPHDLTHVQFVLLASLAWLGATGSDGSGPALTQRALAQHARVDVMMTSQVLRALEAKGLVRRRIDPSDARARLVVLTAEGVDRANRAVVGVEAADAAFFAPLGVGAAAFVRELALLGDAPAQSSAAKAR